MRRRSGTFALAPEPEAEAEAEVPDVDVMLVLVVPTDDSEALDGSCCSRVELESNSVLARLSSLASGCCCAEAATPFESLTDAGAGESEAEGAPKADERSDWEAEADGDGDESEAEGEFAAAAAAGIDMLCAIASRSSRAPSASRFRRKQLPTKHAQITRVCSQSGSTSAPAPADSL